MEGELLRLGPIALYSYGSALATAFLIGTAFSVREAARRRLDVLLLVDLIVRLVMIGVLAGRLGYCLPDIGFYLRQPWEFFLVSQGGLSYIPAFVAAVAYAWRFAKQHDLPVWELLDTLSPGLAVGLIIGFLGAVEVQSEQAAIYVGVRYWAPPTLAFFTVEFSGLWYLTASRRRLMPGLRFCQVVVVDAAARLLSSGWAWVIYQTAMPHAISVVVGALQLAGAIVAGQRLKRMEYPSLKEATVLDAKSALADAISNRRQRRKRLPVRIRILRAGIWMGAYLILFIMLGRTAG